MEVDFAKSGGLVPCVAVDALTGEVLTLAYMNEEALRLTRETRQVHYWSRSRNRLWRKGEESGHVQEVVALELDCDGDAVVAKVLPHGPACHTGARTCFHRRLWGDGDVPLLALADVLEARVRDPQPGSHTSRLLADENLRLKKVAEESGELIMAAKDRDKARVAEETADVVFHALVAAKAEGVDLRDVLAVLAKRRARRGP